MSNVLNTPEIVREATRERVQGAIAERDSHRKRLAADGVWWEGTRIDKETELLRSSDIWFRPVQLGNGPDGALYIVDMYREVIEHPDSLPPVVKIHLDLPSGRTAKPAAKAARKPPNTAQVARRVFQPRASSRVTSGTSALVMRRATNTASA